MFSAYVVVPAPPNAPATVVAAPSGVLGDQHDDDRKEQQDGLEREVRRGELWETDPAGLTECFDLARGRRRLERDAVEVCALVGVQKRDVHQVHQPGGHPAGDHGEQDRDAPKEAAQEHQQADRDAQCHQREPLVSRPVSLVGDRAGEVETDQHDDGAGQDRW